MATLVAGIHFGDCATVPATVQAPERAKRTVDISDNTNMEYISDDLLDTLITNEASQQAEAALFKGIQYLRVGNWSAACHALKQSVHAVAADDRAGAIVRGKAMSAIGTCERWLGDLEASLRFHRQGINILTQRLGAANPITLEAVIMFVETLFMARRFSEAREWTAAISQLEAKIGQPVSEKWEKRFKLLDTQLRLHELREPGPRRCAGPECDRFYSGIETNLWNIIESEKKTDHTKDTPVYLISSLHMLAELKLVIGDVTSARDLGEQAYEQRNRFPYIYYSFDNALFRLLGVTESRSGNAMKSEEYFSMALQHLEARPREAGNAFSTTFAELAAARYERHEIDRAVDAAVEARRRAQSDKILFWWLDYAVATKILAKAFADRGDIDEAISFVNEYLDILESHMEDQNLQDVLRMYDSVAEFLAVKAHNISLAEQVYKRGEMRFIRLGRSQEQIEALKKSLLMFQARHRQPLPPQQTPAYSPSPSSPKP